MVTLTDIVDQFYLGEDWLIDFACKNEAGVALDITGATLEFRIQKGAVEFKYTLANGITLVSAVAGTGTLAILPAGQTLYTKGLWNYELWIQLLDGSTSLQCKGTMTIGASLKNSFP